MKILSPLIFALCSTMDCFTAGLWLGLRRTRVPPGANLLVAVLTLLGTVLAMGSGQQLTPYLSAQAAALAGGGIILAFGVWGLLHSAGPATAPEPAENAPTVCGAQALLLGSALSLNNLGLGVGASITGLAMVPAALCCFAASLAFLWGGNRLGCSHLAAASGSRAERAANLLLILLGLWEMFF